MKIDPCEVCGTRFKSIFEMVDHLLEEDEQDFDPVILLPNGYKLLVGTLLRLVYDNSSKPSQVRDIVSSAYMNLYLAETNQVKMKKNIEDILVKRFALELDEELHKLLEEDGNNEE